MKRFQYILAAAVIALAGCGKEGTEEQKPEQKVESGYQIGGIKASDFTIIYAEKEADKTESEAAARIRKAMSVNQKVNLAVKPASASGHSAHEILIGQTDRSVSKLYYLAANEAFSYNIVFREGHLVISGGEWGILKAADILAEKIAKGEEISSNFSLKGSARGEMLFPRNTDSTLRILDDNIWQYDTAAIPDIWKELGADPQNSARAPQFAALVQSFMPDIFALQEYSSKMHAVFMPLIEKAGYKKCVTSQTVNFTPLFYNPQTVEMIKEGYVLFTPSTWSNSNTKSFTWGVFRLKSNGCQFIVVGTHLWWKSESAQAGSNQARVDQAKVIIAKVNELLKDYDCPVFVTGDMNCNLNSEAMKQFLNAGYEPCSKIASVFADGSKGHHTCSAESGFAAPGDTSGDEGMTAIDQFFVYNKKSSANIRYFRRMYAEFAIRLTDHCPNYCDIALK